MIECPGRNVYCGNEVPKFETIDGILKLSSVKLFMDGALGSWGAGLCIISCLCIGKSTELRHMLNGATRFFSHRHPMFPTTFARTFLSILVAMLEPYNGNKPRVMSLAVFT